MNTGRRESMKRENEGSERKRWNGNGLGCRSRVEGRQSEERYGDSQVGVCRGIIEDRIASLPGKRDRNVNPEQR